MITRAEVKYIQSLSEKKFRAEHNVFVAEGPKIINELLKERQVELVSLFATKNWDAEPKHESNLRQVSESELKSISFLTTPNQVLGIFRQKPVSLPYNFHGGWTLVLDAIQDPGNLGTIIRIADWFGIRAVVIGEESTDAYNPKVVQSTMGSIARVDLFAEKLETFFALHNDIAVYASALDGKPVSAFAGVEEGFLIIGNESKGISSKLLQLANHKITIPRLGRAESLNAAVATGILLAGLQSG